MKTALKKKRAELIDWRRTIVQLQERKSMGKKLSGKNNGGEWEG